MGQYYFPILLKKNWKLAKQPVQMTLYSHEFDNGLKLMEHSWVGNSFVRAMQYLIANYGNDLHFVWCGDYADGVKTHYYPNGVDLYSKASELTESNDDHYFFTRNSIPPVEDLHDYKYIINKSKKEYVVVPKYKPSVWQVHPLPILCSDGNGRGGGDYHGNSSKFVGRWAYDIINVSDDKKDIEGYKEIKPNFHENW